MRGLLVLPFAVAFAFTYAAAAWLWAALFPRHFRPRMRATIRRWGRTLLWMLGVRLELSGEEHSLGGGRILMTNHVSVLDLLVYASIWPPAGTVVHKKEFERIPVIGRTMRILGFIPIDRSDAAAGRLSLEEAARRVREEGATLLIAPEGTRSRDGRLQSFKKGPFHLAIATGAPIVIGVMEGVEKVLPGGTWIARPGTVRVRFLPPIATADWRLATLADHIAEVRARFLEFLPDGAG